MWFSILVQLPSPTRTGVAITNHLSWKVLVFLIADVLSFLCQVMSVSFRLCNQCVSYRVPFFLYFSGFPNGWDKPNKQHVGHEWWKRNHQVLWISSKRRNQKLWRKYPLLPNLPGFLTLESWRYWQIFTRTSFGMSCVFQNHRLHALSKYVNFTIVHES